MYYENEITHSNVISALEDIRAITLKTDIAPRDTT